MFEDESELYSSITEAVIDILKDVFKYDDNAQIDKNLAEL